MHFELSPTEVPTHKDYTPGSNQSIINLILTYLSLHLQFISEESSEPPTVVQNKFWDGGNEGNWSKLNNIIPAGL